ncbi:MAG: aldehyde dehydrogenase family protein, partial [Xanthobacteraceae bacterium]
MDALTDIAPFAIDAVFRRQVALSRGAPPPSAAERRDRLRRLRALVRDNETAFAAAISADFGNRSTVETLMAETLFVQGEIRHATRQLRGWMAPRRIATQLQFMPGKNRLLPQPLGVVGIIAPWNYPLQLTLAPAVAAIAAGNRVMIKPSELAPRFAKLLRETVAASFDVAEFAVTGIEDGVAKAFSEL